MYKHGLMDPTIATAAILVAGGVLFALVAVFAVRAVSRLALAAPETARRLAELEGRMPALEANAAEALDTAQRARKIASSRKAKRDRDAKRAESEPASSPAPVNPFDVLRGQHSGRFTPAPSDGTVAKPVDVEGFEP